mmetsp:Transcript_4149/g.8797  ORF Transcript_4149/g.8797 Transcript_4149/m.8797 type:complete len:81 (-) Transcript_4149:514-756(-)
MVKKLKYTWNTYAFFQGITVSLLSLLVGMPSLERYQTSMLMASRSEITSNVSIRLVSLFKGAFLIIITQLALTEILLPRV